MGEMTIRNLDDALLAALREKASLLGMNDEAFAADLIRKGLAGPGHHRATVARAIQAAQPAPSHLDSVDFIRADRRRR